MSLRTCFACLRVPVPFYRSTVDTTHKLFEIAVSTTPTDLLPGFAANIFSTPQISPQIDMANPEMRCSLHLLGVDHITSAGHHHSSSTGKRLEVEEWEPARAVHLSQHRVSMFQQNASHLHSSALHSLGSSIPTRRGTDQA